jgi:xylulokinase
MKTNIAEDNTVYALGIDFGTQSVKIVVVDVYDPKVIYTGAFEYDTVLSRYGTRGGVLPTKHPEIRHTSPLMLIEAVDLVFWRLQEDGVDVSRLRVIKIDAMQHCTVYTDESFVERVMAFDPSRTLLPQIEPSITRETCPIWEDRAPVEEAAYLMSAFEEHGSMNVLTGNRVELRFPASQILMWARHYPDKYSRTAHIFILSAFLSSIIAGKSAPVDTGDGWGTNLNTLDIRNPGWNDAVLKVADAYLHNHGIASTLHDKLGEMAHYDTVLGPISHYFVERYGVSSEAIVLLGTGDNPATLLGCGGNMVISLGSSYTVNGEMQEIIPSSTGEYNIFGYIPGRAMALTVFTNGAKVHEFFLEKYSALKGHESSVKKDWESYVRAAGQSIINDNEKLMLPYLLDESIPQRSRGIVRDGFDDRDVEAEIRALHISQALSLRLHSNHLNYAGALCVVGGGSQNRFLRQIIADVFDASVYTIRHADFAAAFGCAISGAKTILRVSYEECASRFIQVDRSLSMDPIPENQIAIQTLLCKYAALEKSTGIGLHSRGNPS